MKQFRTILSKYRFLLPELSNLITLKEKLWISYLKSNEELYNSLVAEYEKGQKEIEIIIFKAKKEETKWREVIEIFNRRFYVPFVLSVENQEDVILKSAAPNIKFEFQENGDKRPLQESEILQVLSSGEIKALYILNIIFEVEARRNGGIETLFIIDDIADSFDYKNKYAIIEYLKGISEQPLFKLIILSHNFDFYRTVCGRLDMNRNNKLYTIKTADEVKLVEEKYQKNPFYDWRNNLSDKPKLVASIPFVRNIAEFTGEDGVKNKLTSLLHIKTDTLSIKISDLQAIYRTILKDKHDLELSNPEKIVIELVFETADDILSQSVEYIQLENKIVLAIAIRLKAEQYMIREINDSAFCNGITGLQTNTLLTRFKEQHVNITEEIKILERVQLMTPENIHLNSFMYEPILDMSDYHLKQLYSDVKSL